MRRVGLVSFMLLLDLYLVSQSTNGSLLGLRVCAHTSRRWSPEEYETYKNICLVGAEISLIEHYVSILVPAADPKELIGEPFHLQFFAVT
jgi:hypothetical protein